MIKILFNLQPTTGLEIFISDQKDFAVCYMKNIIMSLNGPIFYIHR